MAVEDRDTNCEVCELAALDEATKCLGDKHISDTASPQYPITKMRYLKSYLTLVLRVVLPIFVTAYYVWLRNQRSVVNGVRRQLFPAILAAITSSVTLTTLSGAVSSPYIKIDPLLRAIKRRPKTVRQECPSSPPSPEKSVTCDVLHEPVTSRVRADVIFIHGLHGSLVNTWRQGTWDAANVRTAPIARGPDSRPDDGYCEPPIDDTWVRDRNRSTDDSEADLQDYLMSDEEGVYDETKLATMMNDICRKSAAAAEGPVGAEPYSPCWPRDWLPLDCPGVRVIALNYTTDPFLWRPFWVTKRIRTCLSERCREMMEHLKKLGVGQNPIVWVGHSKGGLFVKQMLIDAHQDESLGLYGLCSNTKSIMFYSVPHRGSSCADINLPLLRQSVELTEVQRECPEVLELHSKFLALIEESHLHAEIFSFIETVQTMMSFIYLQIVTIESAGQSHYLPVQQNFSSEAQWLGDEVSACLDKKSGFHSRHTQCVFPTDPGIGQLWGVPLDHRNICKPASRAFKRARVYRPWAFKRARACCPKELRESKSLQESKSLPSKSLKESKSLPSQGLQEIKEPTVPRPSRDKKAYHPRAVKRARRAYHPRVVKRARAYHPRVVKRARAYLPRTFLVLSSSSLTKRDGTQRVHNNMPAEQFIHATCPAPLWPRKVANDMYKMYEPTRPLMLQLGHSFLREDPEGRHELKGSDNELQRG
uniref:Protein SERAC1 n=1 Tax=Timema monikensis TaxID=170555 RepID=A0A7R9EAZ3_9NEOP|nr:unnamed protein product [Timema monikensis]